ncbi:DeoR/GlpR family DNA-binding transcription regulator [Thalassoglobus sp.]|uniref:DeoR/GlpR family DNA-binding transcription regulator n=1 Tax=Thalassoglobus sp. TaxID=2795869 RepID=UPI003AA82F33
MLVEERRDEITQVIQSKGFISLGELSCAINVSESTIRRDLEYLEGIGQVRRTRGGASYVGDALTGFDVRRNLASTEKQKIGRATAELIGRQETIILDGGTTTLEVAKHLAGKGLQVVTNSLPIANHLVGVADVELIYLGGYVYPKTGVALGELTIEALKRVHARRLIMSVGGITERGLFNTNSLLAETERQMIESVDEVIVVADHTKFGHSELAHLGPLEIVHKLVVDENTPKEWLTRLEKLNIECIVAN